MKHFLILSVLYMMLPLSLFAQSYDDLWKRVDAAGSKDLPKTQIDLLTKIAKKAQREKAYGQLWLQTF